jgi:hypothetical protein
MDNSKLPGFTKKSSETPWTPTHERKKLSDRAGTTGKSGGTSIIPPIGIGLLLQGVGRTPKKKKRSWVGDKISKGSVTGGKYPGTDKPISHRLMTRWSDPTKGKTEESEY